MKDRFSFGLILALAALGCGGDDGGSNGGSSEVGKARRSAANVCAQYCKRATAAKCPNDVESECQIECVSDLADISAACDPQLDAYASCAVKSSFSCDEDGEAVPTQCAREEQALALCDESASSAGGGGLGRDAGTSQPVPGSGSQPVPGSGSQPVRDAGTSQPGRDASTSTPGPSTGGQCSALVSGGTQCNACQRDYCCDEIATCLASADCARMVTCVSGCSGNQTCVEGCIGNSLAAAQSLLTALECVSDVCELECGD